MEFKESSITADLVIKQAPVAFEVNIQRENVIHIIADNDEEYHSKMNDVTERIGHDFVEVKKVIGMIIPISVELTT